MKNSITLLFGFVMLSPAIALGQGKDAPFIRSNPKFLGAFRDVVAKSSDSTVRIQCDGKDTALGMVVDSDGWILTKFNDLHGKISVKLKDGRTYEAKLTGVHKQHDLAMLKIDANDLPAVKFHDSKGVTAGEWIACTGQGDNPVAIGVVSVSTRNVAFKGPVFKGDPSKSGYLGISMEPTTGGVKIMMVSPGTAAAKAGIKVNDVVIALQGKNYSEPDDFVQAMLRHKPGETIKLKILRGEEELEIEPTLGKRPAAASRSDFQNKMGSELSTRRTGYPTILQHDSVLKPVDCGGPIVDLNGRVIGINICRAGRVESWAVPAEIIRTHMKDLMTGKLAPPELPATGEDTKTDEPAKKKKGRSGKKGKAPTSVPEAALFQWPDHGLSLLPSAWLHRPAGKK